MGNPISFIDPLGLDTWIGGSVEADVVFILFGGISKVTGWLTNTSTGEKCYYITKCKKVGVGVMGFDLSGSGNIVFNGPKNGKDLAGISVGMGLDAGPVALAGTVDSNGASNFAGGGGMGPIPGAGSINAMARAAGINKNVSTHTFRHTCATHMMKNGAPVRHIQELLGHESLESTQIYTRVTISDLKEAHAKYHPGNRG